MNEHPMALKFTGRQSLFDHGGFLGLPPWLRALAAARGLTSAFRFLDRSERLARRFKLAILLGTAMVVFTTVVATSSGRYSAAWLATRSRWCLLQLVGMPPAAKRSTPTGSEGGFAISSRRGASSGAPTPNTARRCSGSSITPGSTPTMRCCGGATSIAHSTCQVRSSRPMTPDGRTGSGPARVRSGYETSGSRAASLPTSLSPSSARLSEVVEGTGALVVETSVQTTNSWGLRGPEPDTKAPLRGIVLGDSYMQGLFVGDDQTPSECLKRELSARLKIRTEVLNTGHLGYSPEQEYFTLKEYTEKFHPQFVVLSLFANDFGDLFEVLEGKGDWDEGKYWLGQITQFCRSRSLICLVVPAPWVNQLEGPRNAGFYPGMVSNILESTGLEYLDPIEDFENERLRQKLISRHENRPSSPNPLFNGQLGDGHFSPLGCQVWARCVAARLVRLLEYRRAAKLIDF